MFLFIFFPPAVPTFSKKEQFPFPPGSQVHGMTVCDTLLPHSRQRPILPAAKRVRFGDAVPPHAPACTASGGVAHTAQPVSLANAHMLTRLLDSVRQAQAPVQDAQDYQMHPAPGLVCSDRPEGRLLSCFNPSATQTIPTVCEVRGSTLPFGVPVSMCLYEGCRGRPCPATGSGRQGPQLPRQLAYLGPIQRAVVRSQGLGASTPQPVGASGQLGKEQALPCAENLFSQCGVRLSEYDGMPHGRACPSSAELPEFLQRQECGTAETVSEAPGAYGIRSCSHASRVASYETTSALATLPSPEVGMAPRYTSGKHHSAVSPLPQPLDGPCLSTGRGAPRTSVPAYCSHNRCLKHGLGRYMQQAGSLGALDGAPTCQSHLTPPPTCQSHLTPPLSRPPCPGGLLSHWPHMDLALHPLPRFHLRSTALLEYALCKASGSHS